MQLDAAETRDLAALFSKRFPAAADRRRLALGAGVAIDRTEVGDEVAAWASLVSAAQAQGKLAALASELAAAAPGDEILVAACRELGARPGGRAARTTIRGAAVGIALGAVVVGIGVIAMSGDGEPTPVASPKVATVSAEAPVEASEPAAAPAAAPTPKSEPTAEVTAPALRPEPKVEAAPAPRPAAPVAATGSRDAIGCPGRAGEVAGYWYAGRASPGAQGDEITIGSGARVRADYPRKDNRFDSRATERCALLAGARVKLEHAPIEVSAGQWWVPYGWGTGRK
jgi:cell division septation protein DedD